MLYSILKELADSAGNIGFVLDQTYTGDDAGVIALMQSLIAADSIPRHAEIATDIGVRVINPQ